MHERALPRKSPIATSSAAPVGTERHRLAFLALVVANVALAFGPWFVRLADTGPVASGFWRITLAAPILCLLAVAGGARPVRLSAPGISASCARRSPTRRCSAILRR
jgi:hypothetical protein